MSNFVGLILKHFWNLLILIANLALDIEAIFKLKPRFVIDARFVPLSPPRAIDWLYVVNMEISMVKTKVGCYGNQILALQPCGGNPYGA